MAARWLLADALSTSLTQHITRHITRHTRSCKDPVCLSTLYSTLPCFTAPRELVQHDVERHGEAGRLLLVALLLRRLLQLLHIRGDGGEQRC